MTPGLVFIGERIPSYGFVVGGGKHHLTLFDREGADVEELTSTVFSDAPFGVLWVEGGDGVFNKLSDVVDGVTFPFGDFGGCGVDGVTLELELFSGFGGFTNPQSVDDEAGETGV